MSITQQQALEALEDLKHAGPDGWGPIEHFTTLRQYIEQQSAPDVVMVPWAEVRAGRGGEIAIFARNYDTRLASFERGGDSGLSAGTVLHASQPQQKEQP
jgi:hypothetical protein